MNKDYRYSSLAEQMYKRIEQTLTTESKNKDQ